MSFREDPGGGEENVEPLDKRVIGERIKSLRKAKGLRQWQMAELLGATQPAVHKYENGILPEVKRLLELARIGNTSIEWILTGRHWENGSTEMNRLAGEIYDLAYRLESMAPADRAILTDALEVLGEAVAALRDTAGRDIREVSDADLGSTLRAFERHARGPLVAALAVYDAVITTLADSKVRDLHRFDQPVSDDVQPEIALSGPKLQKNAG
jgi:transcriptional regulator with XRE-family HTH domain